MRTVLCCVVLLQAPLSCIATARLAHVAAPLLSPLPCHQRARPPVLARSPTSAGTGSGGRPSRLRTLLQRFNPPAGEEPRWLLLARRLKPLAPIFAALLFLLRR